MAKQQPRPNDAAARPRRRSERPPIDFDLLPGLIGYNIRRAQVAVFHDFAATLSQCELTPGQFGVLVLINANEGLNQTRLGEALGIERSTVVAVIDRLEDRGLVARTPSPDDRRSHALQLTADGRALLNAAIPLVRAHEAKFAARMAGDEQDRLIELLDRLAGRD